MTMVVLLRNMKSMQLLLVLFYCKIFSSVVHSESFSTERGNPNFWHRLADIEISRRLKTTQDTFGRNPINSKTAKNVIFFLGDGMGMSTITAARIYSGQKKQQNGLDGYLTFDQFPHVSLAKVNAYDTLVADSANSATAYLRGVKANKGTIGVTADVKLKNCSASLEQSNRLESLLDWNQAEGKLTGFVTTTRVTHATPAGLYAHTAFRDWEGDAPEGCEDIAQQLVYGRSAQNLRVIFGGGRNVMMAVNCSSVCPDKSKRVDSRDMVKEWLAEKNLHKQNAKYITSRSQLKNLRAKDTDFVMGVFATDHMEYMGRKQNNSEEPSLTEMTIKALEILKKGDKGYFLFVEGGRIDLAHHDNQALLALEETVEFEKAIAAVLAEIDLDDTLVVVTADHSHGFTINGYAQNTENILGFAERSPALYTTLMYSTGPGQLTKLTNESRTDDVDFQQKSLIYMDSAVHAGEDVPVYAIGVGSYLFSGVHDQTYIPHAISYVARIGRYAHRPNSAAAATSHISLLLTTAATCFSMWTKAAY